MATERTGKPNFLNNILERAVGHEDRIVTPFAQHLRDADAIHRRAEGRLGKKHDGLAVRHASLLLPIKTPPTITLNNARRREPGSGKMMMKG